MPLSSDEDLGSFNYAHLTCLPWTCFCLTVRTMVSLLKLSLFSHLSFLRACFACVKLTSLK
jgi:hypothetical protein